MWDRLFDRRGPRGVLLAGLLGFGATMLVFSIAGSLAAVYAERFLSGMFAAAVTPVAAAAIPLAATAMLAVVVAVLVAYALPGASFVLTAGLALLGFLLSLGLPHLLVARKSRARPVSA